MAKPREIPVPLVRANQWVLVIGTILAIILQNMILLAILFVINLIPLFVGPQGNIVFRIAKPLLRKKIKLAETEAAELQRFNQTIATLLLASGLILFWTTEHWAAWIRVAMVTVAASVALGGFCIGCFIYFQWKQWRHKAG
jgi:hypothetical protein